MLLVPVFRTFLSFSVSQKLQNILLRLTSLVTRRCLRKLIEDMEITLIFNLTNNSSLFKEIIGDLSANWFAIGIEHDFQVFPLQVWVRWVWYWQWRCLTCRLELLFLRVLAHPKLSNSGLVARTMSLISLILLSCPPDTAAMYCMIRFAASVFPAPDSPEMMTHWFSW